MKKAEKRKKIEPEPGDLIEGEIGTESPDEQPLPENEDDFEFEILNISDLVDAQLIDPIPEGVLSQFDIDNDNTYIPEPGIDLCAKPVDQICFKVHRTSARIVAICDSDLINKKFKDEKRGIEIEVKESFYGSKKADFDEIDKIIEGADSINILGDKIIDYCVGRIGRKFVKEQDVITIAGIKHAVIFYF